MNSQRQERTLRFNPENVRKTFEHCSWCDKISSRFNWTVIPEGIIKEQIKSHIESHGMCHSCVDKIRDSESKRRSTVPPSNKSPKSPRAYGEEALLQAVA